MWINRRLYEKTITTFRVLIQSQREELAGERAARAFAMQRMSELKIEHVKELEEFRRRLAISQANFEWLTVSHNQANVERQALFNARGNVNLPPVQVDFVAPPQPGADGEPTPARRPAGERAMGRSPDIADLVDQGLSFDDIGERAASILGLDVAARIYDDPSALLT